MNLLQGKGTTGVFPQRILGRAKPKGCSPPRGHPAGNTASAPWGWVRGAASRRK